MAIYNYYVCEAVKVWLSFVSENIYAVYTIYGMHEIELLKSVFSIVVFLSIVI